MLIHMNLPSSTFHFKKFDFLMFNDGIMKYYNIFLPILYVTQVKLHCLVIFPILP